ncbi:MAG: hypothetical protein A2341_22045 [Deltaproteobacteria bacterium RIFOXYB12_FULL_58_9]|nr:MAG: hypothetical protein A2341_22045 [Deltaproteobacteria bacterium RIFOXYB12_FULL_58_9]
MGSTPVKGVPCGDCVGGRQDGADVDGRDLVDQSLRTRAPMRPLGLSGFEHRGISGAMLALFVLETTTDGRRTESRCATCTSCLF